MINSKMANEHRRRTGTTIILPGGGPSVVNLRGLWQNRDLIRTLSLRSIRARYRETSAGILWAFAQPLIYMLVLNTFFGLIVRFKTGEIPYALHLLTGLVAFQFFYRYKFIWENSQGEP